MSERKMYLVGCASGVAGADEHSGDGPLVMQNSRFLSALINQGMPVLWDTMIKQVKADHIRIDEAVRQSCEALAQRVSALLKQQQHITIIGGDHSCAIGTWSGVYDALQQKGDLGLVWVDAHMDSHTPETSESGRVHGMPVACLLGYGYPTLTSVLHSTPKIKPEHLCLIGVRSFERGEAELLERLQVRIYFMDEVKQRGFASVLREAVALVSRGTVAYGLTLDLDSIDPHDAPGVDVPEADGIHVDELLQGLAQIAVDPKLIATEIVEFDPLRDKDQMTEKLIVKILEIIVKGKMA